MVVCIIRDSFDVTGDRWGGGWGLKLYLGRFQIIAPLAFPCLMTLLPFFFFLPPSVGAGQTLFGVTMIMGIDYLWCPVSEVVRAQSV